MPEQNSAIGRASIVQMHLDAYKWAAWEFRNDDAFRCLRLAKVEMDRLVERGLPPDEESPR